MIRVLLFGELAELAGDSKISFEEVNNSDTLKDEIYKLYPSLKEKSFLIAINKKIVTEKTEIDNDAEIALLPPFSGG